MTQLRWIALGAAVALAGGSGLLIAQGGPTRGMGGGMGGMMRSSVQAPPDNPITPEKVALGRQLYFDGRLSKDGSVSCNSCHHAAAGGADGRTVSIGVGGAQGTRNAPTVWNAAFHQAQFWDGRASSLEEQAKGPLINPVEMANPNFDAVVERVKSIPSYVRQFQQVFGKDGVTIDNIAKASATYERTLVNANSRFDSFRFADKGSLTQAEFDGFVAFRQSRCMECHMGPDFNGPPPLARGAGFYQTFPRFSDNTLVAKYKLLDDPGRYTATRSETDRHVWRVPTLRNVAQTAPYFHNGKVATLDEAVRLCAKGGSNLDLTEGQAASIAAFLRTLDGRAPDQTAPKLP